jgi:uncharacterized membrane protein
MILGTPITWLFVEILAVVLFIICIIHASKQENALIKTLEMLGFIVYSGIYENIGVFTKIYDYDQHRIMLIGKVPLEILLLEAVIFYAALRLVEFLRIPAWGKALVVGFLASVQDMTIDPSAAFDLHSFNGVMSGQWNWTPRYAGTFFGIPFFNFSGWMVMIAFYVIAIQVGMWLYKKYNKEIIGYLYPFLSAFVALGLLVSISRFFLFGYPFFPLYTRGAEIALLVFNYFVGLFILLRFQKIDRPFDFKKDASIFIVPIALHVYDVVVAFALKIQIAYIPAVAVSLIHIAYLLFVYFKSNRLGLVTAKHREEVLIS